MLGSMAEVEQDRFWDVDLALAAKATGIAAIVLGIAVLLRLVQDFGTTEAVLAVIGTDGYFLISRILWIARIAATAVVAGGLIVGWRQERLLWSPGIGLVALGLVLLWGWWAVDRYTDVWNLGRFTGVEPDNPELLNTLRAMVWVNTGVSIVTIALLLVGGIQLVRKHSRN